MRQPPANGLKAWSEEYDETPFFFEQDHKHGRRLVAWTDEPEQIKVAFYAMLDFFPAAVEVLLKINMAVEDEPLWSRYHAEVELYRLIRSVHESETYIFSDGRHQFCVKDPESDHYLAFDDHGIFFVYSPDVKHSEMFDALGFKPRYAEPIFSLPHFHHIIAEAENAEMKVVEKLGLTKANSDLDDLR